MNHDPAADLADLRALQKGEDAALNRLIARWERPLFAFAWRYVRSAPDAQELAIEVFVRLYQHRMQLSPDSNVAAWLFTTLSNLCRNHHRWKQRHPTVQLDDADEASGGGAAVAPAEVSPDFALEQREALSALAAAVEALPHDLKVPLLLYHYEALSYREIGDMIGCSERGVETRLYRARRRLREELGATLRETAAP